MKDEFGDLKWVDYGGITFSFDARHSELHDCVLPKILENFEGIERRGAANILNSNLLLIFLFNQLDAIYSTKSRQEIVECLWKAKISEVGVEEQFKSYIPSSSPSREIWQYMRHEDWTNPATWQKLKRAIKR